MVDNAPSRAEHLIEVHVTAIEGSVSDGVRRRLIESNLALLEPLVEQLRGRLSAYPDPGGGRVAASRAGASRPEEP